MAVHKRKTMLAHCNLKQNMWLCSKQSSFFSFYALPSGGESKDAVVHYDCRIFLRLVTVAKTREDVIEYSKGGTDKVQWHLNWIWHLMTSCVPSLAFPSIYRTIPFERDATAFVGPSSRSATKSQQIQRRLHQFRYLILHQQQQRSRLLFTFVLFETGQKARNIATVQNIFSVQKTSSKGNE